MNTVRTLVLAGVVAAVLALTGAYALGSVLVTSPSEAVDKVSKEVAEQGGQPGTERQPEVYGGK